MNEDFEPFLEAARDIASERGDFAVFILALREEMAGVMSTSAAPVESRWDVLFAAPWVEHGRRAPLEYLASKIAEHGGQRSLRGLARVISLPMSDPLVKRIVQAIGPLGKSIPPVTTSYAITEIDPTVVGPGIRRAVAIAVRRRRNDALETADTAHSH